MDHLFACTCGEVLVKSSPGLTKIRNKILVFRSGKAFAVCPKCDRENPVPVTLDEPEMMKSARQPKLFLREQSKLVLDDKPASK